MSCDLTVDLCATQYASFRHDFNKRDPAKVTIDYTSSRATMTIRLRSTGAELLTLSSVPTTGDRIILGAVSPNISIRITQATMAGIAPAAAGDDYEYSLLVRPEPDTNDYNTDPIVTGLFVVDVGITAGVP